MSTRVAASPAARPAPGTLSRRGHGLLSNLLLASAALLLLAAGVFVWAKDTLFDSAGFADAATASVEDEAVRERIEVTLADQVIERRSGLAPARPLIEGAAEAVIDSRQFESIFRTAAADLHDLVFDEGSDEVILDLSAALARVIDLLQVIAPEVAAQIPQDVDTGLIRIGESELRTELIRWGERVSVLAFVLPLLSIAAFAGAICLARDRRAALFRVGMALAIVGAVAVLALSIGSWLVRELLGEPDNGDAAVALWWTWVDSLRMGMRAVGVLGITLAAGTWWITNKGWPSQLFPGSRPQ